MCIGDSDPKLMGTDTLIIQSAGHTDNAGIGINGKAAAGIVGKTEGHDITIQVRGGHLTDDRTRLSVFTHLLTEHQALLVNV